MQFSILYSVPFAQNFPYSVYSTLNITVEFKIIVGIRYCNLSIRLAPVEHPKSHVTAALLCQGHEWDLFFGYNKVKAQGHMIYKYLVFHHVYVL